MIPERYPVIELTDGGYAERTAQNVADSDGTLIISNGEPIGGTRETVERCVEMKKPYLIIDCKLAPINQAIDLAIRFVSHLSSRAKTPVRLGPKNLTNVRTRLTTEKAPGRQGDLGTTIVLNVAGPRASQWQEGHAITCQIMSAILRRISGQNGANEYN